MCNCGKKRSAFSEETIPGKNNTSAKAAARSTPAFTSFQYTGKTAVTIIGNVTGTKYRFGYPGNTQNISHLDTPGMMSVAVLKKV